MKIKPNCFKCYYGGLFSEKEHLASCRCEEVTEPTYVYHDFMESEIQCVARQNWEDECNCEHFMPNLKESEDDYELEMRYSFSTSFDCPFCGNTIDVWDIDVEEIKLVTCEECGRKMAVHGKEL